MEKENKQKGLPPKYYELASSILKFVEQVEKLQLQDMKEEENHEAE